MTHPLVQQLRFARSEFQRGLVGVTAEEAKQRILPMNCVAWNIGHLAWQEQRYWLFRAQEKTLLPELNEQFAYGAPACTPDLDKTQEAWRTVTEASEAWLDGVTTQTLQRAAVTVTTDSGPLDLTWGSLLLRTIYHYWYHTGENQAIRQVLGHTGLPDFVGDIDIEAPYAPEQNA
jgi:uncharacterized damage-inducible protein DinB